MKADIDFNEFKEDVLDVCNGHDISEELFIPYIDDFIKDFKRMYRR